VRLRPVALAAAATLLGASGLTAAALAGSTGDQYDARQWGLQQVRAPQAWSVSTGAGAVVAIVDSGVDRSHPELKDKLVGGATFSGCAKGSKGPDGSCGNGDWLDGDDASASEHGTHVAGIAAATAGNGIGIAGVAPDASILPVKVLDEEGGSFADIAAGIRYAADNGADVINLSLGALPGIQALTLTGLISDVQKAIDHARARGVVVVAAAGNDFQVPLCGTPAFDRGALCVTATDKREAPAAYSNMGINQQLQSVAAPGGSLLPICGEDVLSTVPAGTGRSGVCGYTDDYDEYAGTSMAAPHVAGVATLLAATGMSGDQIMSTLLRTSRQPLSGLRGVFTPSYGYGIVDAVAALGGSTPTSASPSPSPTAEQSPSPSPSPTAEENPTTEPSPSPSPKKGNGGGGGGGKPSPEAPRS
jgi:subtilisin family serine protease